MIRQIMPYSILGQMISKWENIQIFKSITELAMPIKSDGNAIIVSGIVPQFDNLNKVNEINNPLELACVKRDISFSFHSEIINSS